MNGRRSLRQRAEDAGIAIPIRRAPDFSKGRGFDPFAPHEDGLGRVMITRVPMVHTETGELFTAYHVDYFNLSNADEAATLYREGQTAIDQLVRDNGRPEPYD